MPAFLRALLLASALLTPLAAGAQQAPVAFGGLQQNTALPVEVTADSLTVSQADGTALFSGNVLVKQGDMRLAAGQVRVEYGPDKTRIARLFASGGVTLAGARDAAEAREAVYTIDSGKVEMTGDVVLTQGSSAISGQALVLDLKSGTGVMEGRVTTVFTPGGGN